MASSPSPNCATSHTIRLVVSTTALPFPEGWVPATDALIRIVSRARTTLQLQILPTDSAGNVVGDPVASVSLHAHFGGAL